MSDTLSQFSKIFGDRASTCLKHCLPDTDQSTPTLVAAMRYSLLSGGKRIRPILNYASAKAVIGLDLDNIPNALDASACALECIHAYSLIHDDLPAMDDDSLRRGEPTCHIAFDEATAILAGDALQCLAFEILANAEASDGTVLTLIRMLSKAAGHQGMVLGQAIDLSAVAQQPDLRYLENMHLHKTGALIEAAVIMGAIACDSERVSPFLPSLRNYARAVGLAFQVQDDILDVVGDTHVLGKQQGADIERNKPTYVSLLGLDGAKRKAEQLVDQAIGSLHAMGSNADMLRALASYVIQRNN